MTGQDLLRRPTPTVDPDRPAPVTQNRPNGFIYAVKRHRVSYTLLAVEGICAGVLAILNLSHGSGTGTRAGLTATIVLFVATMLQVIAASGSKMAENDEKLQNAQLNGVATLQAATDMQLYFAERMPSLLQYLGNFTASSEYGRENMAEGLEALVVEAAASLYGKRDLRAVVLHYQNGTLRPGNYRKGFDSTPLPQFDGTGAAVLRALRLISEKTTIWVDNPDDPQHSDTLTLRPSHPFRSFIRAPIYAGEFGFGILWVDGREDRSLIHADVTPLNALAQILGAALALTARDGDKLKCAV